MRSFEIFRPHTLDEAIELLGRGIPLAGGTVVTQLRREIPAAIDLSHLKLDQFEIDGNAITLGSGMKLQAVIEAGEIIPDALKYACRLEAGWNLRNMATLAGTIMTGDGRSPLLTVLLALGAIVMVEPGADALPINQHFEKREDSQLRRLLTGIKIENPTALIYEQVSRSPADRPIVCCAIAEFQVANSRSAYQVALGGFGKHPIRVQDAEPLLQEGNAIDAAMEVCQKAYSNAGDEWASAEYRSDVAGVLVGRLATKLMS